MLELATLRLGYVPGLKPLAYMEIKSATSAWRGHRINQELLYMTG
jgi:hypothetical protein